jgi:hypothetical protein
MKIQINDISKFRILKVKDWSITFEYDGQQYLLHSSSETGEGSWQELYKRDVDKNGKYNLEHILTKSYAKDHLPSDYIRNYHKYKTYVYSQIDKRYFIMRLIYNDFAEGILSDEVDSVKNEIKLKYDEIKLYRDKISLLENAIRNLKQFKK